jgi:hypothetical protein
MMNLIHHTKPRLLLSCPYISFAAAKSWQNRRRTFTALAESNSAPVTKTTETQAFPVIPPSFVTSDSQPSKNIQSSRAQTFADKLRLRAAHTERKKKRVKHAEIPRAIAAAKDAISRSHASQGGIIKSLHEAVVSDKQSKRGTKRVYGKADVNTSKTYATAKAPKLRLIKPKEEGWEADEWQDHGWGEDGMHLAASTLFIMQ